MHDFSKEPCARTLSLSNNLTAQSRIKEKNKAYGHISLLGNSIVPSTVVNVWNELGRRAASFGHDQDSFIDQSPFYQIANLNMKGKKIPYNGFCKAGTQVI